MKYRYALAITAGLATLTAGAGIAAAQSDDDVTPDTTVPSTPDTTSDSTTESTPDTTTDSTDGGTGVPGTDQPEARERRAGGEGCGDGGTTAPSGEDTDDSSS